MRKRSNAIIIPAGEVIRVGRSNELISLCSTGIDDWMEDERVYDSHGEMIGRIIGLVGSVRSPYLIVKPGKGVDGRRLVGTSIYLIKEGVKCQSKR